MAEKVLGWAGNIARVDVGTGTATQEPTEPYKKFIGGMGLSNKIMWDEVPAGTDPLSKENKVVLAVGPLTASGVPLGGRCTASSLSTYTKDHLVVDAHMGGMIGARLKFSGHDALIIEGQASKPVYILIKDDKITVEDASDVWGLGTRATTEVLTKRHGRNVCVASIGPAGENLLPYSCLINSRNHSGGAGIGAVLGSKKVKAIVVDGTGSVGVAEPGEVSRLSDDMLLHIIGSNNNHVTPSTQQAWAEYFDPASRWTSQKGLYWKSAEGGPIETGEPKPGELNTVGFRCMKSTKDLGPAAEQYTVKMDGCHSCPIHCHSDLKIEKNRTASGYETSGNTCVANAMVSWFLAPVLGLKFDDPSELVLWNQAISNIVDDYGIWCNYGQIYRDLAYVITSGILEENVSKEEYAEFDWEALFEKQDLNVLVDIFKAIARNDSGIAKVGHGPIVWCEEWDAMDWFNNPASSLISPRGWPVHHAHECCAQVGAVYNVLFNRDDMIHSAVNFDGSGLPFELRREIAGEIWGDPSAYEANKDYTPMNEYKAKFCWWSVVTDVLHDSLTLCNWVWPMTVSPSKDRDYRGDLDLEAKFWKAVTGEEVTTDDLYHAGGRIMTLQRANTIRGMGTTDMRGEHDVYTEWPFEIDPDIPVFTPGTNKMDREDFQTALTMVYREFGWDETTGALTRKCLEDYDLKDVADELDSLGLLV